MIREMGEEEFVGEFFADFAQVECGRHFDPKNQQHVEWVRKRIAIQYFRGCRTYAFFVDGGKPVGFVMVLIDPGLDGVGCLGNVAEIMDILVRDEYCGRGHGRELLAHVEAKAKSAGAYCMYVSHYAGGRDAIAFYLNCGYIPVATHPDVHGPDDEGEVHLRKILGK